MISKMMGDAFSSISLNFFVLIFSQNIQSLNNCQHQLSRLHILYRCDDEYRLECRRLNRGSFLLKKDERKRDFLQISWNRLNELLTVKKYRKTVEK